MPRPAKGPRLKVERRKGRTAQFVIHDGELRIRTGCGEGSSADAERALASYIAQKHVGSTRGHRTDQVAIADVMTFYAMKRAGELAAVELAGLLTERVLEGFGDKLVSQITGDLCREYVAKRADGRLGRNKVKPATAKRELQHLSAAIGFAWREGYLAERVPIVFPPKAGKRRERWLDRTEAARLLAGALGWYVAASDVKTREPTLWRRNLDWRHIHLARFIVIGLYTGTRHDAITRLRWGVTSNGGWIDIDRGVIYRRGDGQRETAKRQPPVPMTDQLLGHMRRARKNSQAGPIEWDGETIAKVRRAWKRARTNVGLDDAVTPHVLRHTCATWMLLNGARIRDAAEWLGASEKMIEAHYGHHSPDHLALAKASFRRINGAEKKKGLRP